jgi:hypothetical protein
MSSESQRYGNGDEPAGGTDEVQGIQFPFPIYPALMMDVSCHTFSHQMDQVTAEVEQAFLS